MSIMSGFASLYPTYNERVDTLLELDVPIISETEVVIDHVSNLNSHLSKLLL